MAGAREVRAEVLQAGGWVGLPGIVEEGAGPGGIVGYLRHQVGAAERAELVVHAAARYLRSLRLLSAASIYRVHLHVLQYFLHATVLPHILLPSKSYVVNPCASSILLQQDYVVIFIYELSWPFHV